MHCTLLDKYYNFNTLSCRRTSCNSVKDFSKYIAYIKKRKPEKRFELSKLRWGGGGESGGGRGGFAHFNLIRLDNCLHVYFLIPNVSQWPFRHASVNLLIVKISMNLPLSTLVS